MPLLQVTAGPEVPAPFGAQHDLDAALSEALPRSGPVIIMIHGYKFAPGHATACPHRHILSLQPGAGPRRKALSWPRGLGFGSGARDEGLGISFGWPARGTIWQAYRAAARAGLALAELIRATRRIAPARPVHLLAHSLGARVALSALAHLPEASVGRAVLLNPAEYGGRARQALSAPAGRSAEIFNITSRENDLFDFLMERLIAPPERGDATLAQTMPRQPNTLTLQLDHAGALQALDEMGFSIAPPAGRVCHWSAYLRPGVFDLYRALLRRPGSYPQARLRALLPETPDPRWSRMLPRPGMRLPRPAQRGVPL